MADPERLFLTLAEVGEATRIGKTKLYSEIHGGRLRVTKLGAKTLVHVDDLKTWAEELRASST